MTHPAPRFKEFFKNQAMTINMNSKKPLKEDFKESCTKNMNSA